MKYRTIVADPPWPYRSTGEHLGSSRTHRPNSYDTPRHGPGSSKRYGSMSLDDIRRLDLQSVVERDAHLYLWTTNSFIEEAHAVARAWGFRKQTIITWGKIKHDVSNGPMPSMRVGYSFRGATEHILFCVRGSLPTTGTWPTLMLWPRTPHSVKPEAFYDLVEQASPGPYLELFARRQRLGWDTWGDQATRSVEIDA